MSISGLKSSSPDEKDHSNCKRGSFKDLLQIKVSAAAMYVLQKIILCAQQTGR